MSITVTFTSQTTHELHAQITEYLKWDSGVHVPLIANDDNILVEAKILPGELKFTPTEGAYVMDDKGLVSKKKKQKITAETVQSNPREDVSSITLTEPYSTALDWETVRLALTEFYKKTNQDKEAMLKFLEQFGVKFVGQLKDKPECWEAVLLSINNTTKG